MLSRAGRVGDFQPKVDRRRRLVGVGNQAQFDFLRYQGCDELQGCLIARPMPAADFVALLARTGGQL